MARLRDVCGGVSLGVGAPLTGLWLASVAVDRWRVVTGPAPSTPEEALTALAAVVGAAVATWLWLGLLLALLGHLPGAAGARCRAAAERTTPAVVRRCAAVVVGASLAGALAPGTATATDGRLSGGSSRPAQAPSTSLSPSFSPTTTLRGTVVNAAVPYAGAPSPAFAPSPVPAHPSAGSATPAPGWTPSRPPVRPQPSTRLVTTAPASEGPRETVVRRGDTLWDIARAHLGPDATDAEVAAEWPRWHEANRSVVGDDPDVLLPGQVLRAPDAVEVLR
ncbi:LysM domain-containing protein [Pedococcus cremeus]|uniref:LysM domain-containing protein n=1 Tax=Pedococcus cremeus TaxID=587636 RepID=A0A1H9XCZ0_9MICO|nr:LysM peptidoglycan-binding domain-containing protein [Pedococcus cremeus]SES43929.1 LysM domain-containing protein [Pedococcus cremeus]